LSTHTASASAASQPTPQVAGDSSRKVSGDDSAAALAQRIEAPSENTEASQRLSSLVKRAKEHARSSSEQASTAIKQPARRAVPVPRAPRHLRKDPVDSDPVPASPVIADADALASLALSTSSVQHPAGAPVDALADDDDSHSGPEVAGDGSAYDEDDDRWFQDFVADSDSAPDAAQPAPSFEHAAVEGVPDSDDLENSGRC